MSSKNNVNPGQYKVAGRERLGENLVQERDKQQLAKNRENLGRQRNRQEPPNNRANVVQARDKAEPGRNRGKVGEGRVRQEMGRARESSRPAKRAAKRNEQLSGRGRGKSSKSST